MNKELKLTNQQKFYLHVLQVEFDKRLKRHKNYSLRKFSYEIGLEPSVVSKYLRRKRSITVSSFSYLMKMFELDPQHLKKREEDFYRSLSEMKLISSEHEDILGNWHAFAILECLNLEDAKPSTLWLAQKTGLQHEVVKKVVLRLFEIGAIAEKDGKWKDQFENLTFITSEEMDTRVGRNFQKTVLEASRKSIEQGVGGKKSHTNVILTVDEKLIPEVLVKIRDFRREICSFIEQRQEKKNNVYNLQINFHSLLKD
ncbi:MAG: DUF4423 domain-containing protein [Bacteriovoracaceae bacterium]|jgi:uncharacterized protein (TIGR02147 family)|nr:hypothetical protein [Halobacteriovoraceae bacterium]MDP7320079.1 DUF4423 domain-containing protein [Bacteriovoracaceae bacterium]